jgi:signal transduction histidine kinase
VLGHALKDALARSWRGVAAVGAHLLTHESANRDLADLRRGLAEADHIAEALLNRGTQISAPATVDVSSLLFRMEPSLALALAPAVSLTIRDSEPRQLVSADVGTLEALIRRLVEGAGRVTPEGGELTVSAGWLDCISGGWPSDGNPPRRYVRLTVATNAPERPGEAWWRVIEPAPNLSKASDCSAASMIERLSGCIMVESAEGQPSRIHVCLPAVFDDSDN